MKISQCCFVGVLGDAITLSQWPSLASKINFMDPTVLCAGYPFECDDNVPPRITGMYLYYWGLSGTLPISIGLLSNLQILDLSSNNLSGIIPDSLGQLSNLQYVGLSSNKLSGIIPDLDSYQTFGIWISLLTISSASFPLPCLPLPLCQSWILVPIS